MIYSSLEYNSHISDKNDINYILQHFEMFNNTRIFFDGHVLRINESRHTISIDVAQRPWFVEVRIPKTEPLPHEGDFVEITGILNTKDYITAEKIFISASWQHDFIYIRSFFAVPFVIYLFAKTWRFNRNKMRFMEKKNA